MHPCLVQQQTTLQHVGLNRVQGVVRIFKLASGAADEYAFMFQQDYTAVVRQQQGKLAAKQTPASHLAVFDWFLHSVVPACPEVNMTGPGACQRGRCEQLNC
jgi:hypothetical protein